MEVVVVMIVNFVSVIRTCKTYGAFYGCTCVVPVYLYRYLCVQESRTVAKGRGLRCGRENTKLVRPCLLSWDHVHCVGEVVVEIEGWRLWVVEVKSTGGVSLQSGAGCQVKAERCPFC